MGQVSKERDNLLESGEFGTICKISSKFDYLLGDPTGILTWQKKLAEIRSANNIVIEWDGKSLEGLFQLGMAFALRKQVVAQLLPGLTTQKSFQNMITAWQTMRWVESGVESGVGVQPKKTTFLICPVRNQSPAMKEILKMIVGDPKIYYPARDTNQDDPLGLRICVDNRAAMESMQEVWFVWDGQSQGSIFDLGMAFAMGKPIEAVYVPVKTRGPSFQNFALQVMSASTTSV